MWLARRELSKRSSALAFLQAALRRAGARHSYMLLQSDKYAATIQSAARRAVARRNFRNLVAVGNRLQSAFRVRLLNFNFCNIEQSGDTVAKSSISSEKDIGAFAKASRKARGVPFGNITSAGFESHAHRAA